MLMWGHRTLIEKKSLLHALSHLIHSVNRKLHLLYIRISTGDIKCVTVSRELAGENYHHLFDTLLIQVNLGAG